jgi:hypothetical protein
MLETCSKDKIYYVHNLTFEIFVFLSYIVKNNIKFKLISADKTIYCAEIFYKDKKIILKCSYRLTMLSLRKLAELAQIEEKSIFPYKILTEKIKKNISVKKEMFENNNEYENFLKIYGKKINTFDILEKYCKNDAYITKKSIIKY